MPGSLECCYLQRFYWHYREEKHAESCAISCYTQHESWKKRTKCIGTISNYSKKIHKSFFQVQSTLLYYSYEKF